MPDLINYEKDKKRGVVKGFWERNGDSKLNNQEQESLKESDYPEDRKRNMEAEDDTERDKKKRKVGTKGKKTLAREERSDNDDDGETKTKSTKVHKACVALSICFLLA